MGRSPCCDVDSGLKKGPWTAEEDDKLREFIKENGHGSWRALPKLAGLNRCGKSCRLRWTNYLRPDIKRGKFSEDEERRIVELHSVRGNKWSEIARHLPGRTDNEIKNYWNTHLRKRLLQKGIDPTTHRPRADLALLASIPSLIAAASLGSIDPVESAMRLHDATQLAKIQLLNNLVQVLATSAPNSYQIDEPSRQLAQLQYPGSDPLGAPAFPCSFDADHFANLSGFGSGSGSSDLMSGFVPEISNNKSNYYDNYTDQMSNPTAENVFGTVVTTRDFDVPTSSNSSGYDLCGENFAYGDDFELSGFIEQYLR